MAYTKDLERMVQERIVNDLAEHTITLLHSDGMYRHWRCQKPGTWNLGFDVVTWPGSLCFTGDMGDYLFQRTEDMVAFMARSCMSYGYAAEKCVAHDGRLEEFREELMEELLTEVVDERRKYLEDEYPGDSEQQRLRLAITEAKVDEIRTAYSVYSDPACAIKAMYESGIWDGCDLPECKAYTFHFLWCLHAIKWFCDPPRRA